VEVFGILIVSIMRGEKERRRNGGKEMEKK
jgi:hypothetical protein